jgi:hypothetical protein
VADVPGGATSAIPGTAVRITGDLFVPGTIDTNHTVDISWMPPAAAHHGRLHRKRRTGGCQGPPVGQAAG